MIELIVTVAGITATSAGIGSFLMLHPRSPMGSPVVRLGAEGGLRLTFDDGPDPRWTPRVLDHLDRIDARASFFVLGEHLEKHPDIVRACAARGHRVEIHGMSHRAATFQRPRELALELDRLGERIEGLTGRRPRWYRPPYGARPLFSHSSRPLRLVTWSWSCGDWAGGAAPEAPIRAPRAGDVLLMHDGPTTETAARLRTSKALDALASAGLKLVALEDP